MTDFHTIEISDPAFESDGLRTVTVKSNEHYNIVHMSVTSQTKLIVRQGSRQATKLPVKVTIYHMFHLSVSTVPDAHCS